MSEPEKLVTAKAIRWRVVIAGLVALGLSACSSAVVPGGEGSTPPQTAAVESAEATDEVAPNDDIGDGPTFPPQTYWNYLATSAGNNSGAESIGDAAGMSDLVVVGRWVGLERGESYATPENETVEWYAVAVIDVDSVIQGTVKDTSATQIRVPFLLTLALPGNEYPEKEFHAVDQARPDEPAILFLHTWSSYFDRAGGEVPEWVSGLDRADRYRTIGADGALPLVGGAVSDVIFEFDMPQWRLGLAGIEIDTIVNGIVAPGATTVP